MNLRSDGLADSVMASAADTFAPGRRRSLLAVALLALGVSRLRSTAAADARPRVVSVGGALTEIVYRLGAQPLLVGTDTTSIYPDAARALPRVGYQRTLSAEGVLSLTPNVLLATADAGPPAALQQLQSAGVRVVRTSAEHSFDALLANVALVADALSMAPAGAALTSELRSEWAVTRKSVRTTAPKPRVLFILSHAANNVQVSGEGTAADAMITLAGGVNAMTLAGTPFKGYRPLAAEAVIAAAPDVILTTREGIEALGGRDSLLTRPGLSLTPAGRNHRVLDPDALLLLGFGPRLPQAVRGLAEGLGTWQ